MNLAILAIVTAFTFIVLGSVASEKLYAQLFPPSTDTPDNDNDNSLNQDCSQSAIGKEITQSQECQQQRDTVHNQDDGFFCPVGYYRNSQGYCVPLLQLSP